MFRNKRKVAERQTGQSDTAEKRTARRARKPLSDKERRLRADRAEVKSFFQRLVILVVFLWLLFGVFFGITPMNSDDMFPRISSGDLLFYYRMEKDFHSDDVIVFKKDGRVRAGRVVAHGGETVEITDEGELKVNGSVVAENNIFYKTYPYEKDTVKYPVSLASGEVFVLCDYREGAKDSRYFGAVSTREIKGKIITILRRSNL